MTRGLRIAITGDIDDGLEDLDSCLRPLCETLESIGIPMTIPIVAHAVENNPRKVVYLAEHGVEVSGHGDIHEGFAGPLEVQRQRLKKMNETFGKVLGVVPAGFRAPFLAHDENLYPALALEGFSYDSSRTSIDLLMRIREMIFRRHMSYRDPLAKIPGTLIRRVTGRGSARPYPVASGVIELPVFELDDWFFFEYERGPHITRGELSKVSDTWMAAARHLADSQSVLVLQAHPKRISPDRLRLLEDFVGRAKAEGYRFSTLVELAKLYAPPGSSRDGTPPSLSAERNHARSLSRSGGPDKE